MQVDFYHLTATPLDRALPQVAEKVLASGARLLIVDADEGRRERLDRLFVTSAGDGVDEPHGGDLFEVDPGVTGLPPHAFGQQGE